MSQVIVNPFDTGGYTLAEMTEAINILPNVYTRLTDMGLFRQEGVTQRVVTIEQANGVINLLPQVPLGGPASVANRDLRSMRALTVPWIPHDDYLTPQDLQGIRGFGMASAADPLATKMNQKLTRMRVKHAQTLEYMEINALRGILKDGSGNTVFNYFTEFGITQLTQDFTFGTPATDIMFVIRSISRAIEVALRGETMTSVMVLCGPGFFDKLMLNTSLKDAFTFYNSTNPLRDDMRRRFPFGGITFEEYNATVTLADGTTTERLIPDNEGIAFPLGTTDTFVTYFAPANLIETVNTMGVPLYARQLARTDGTAIDIKTESSPLPVNKRPGIAVKLFSSN